MLLLVDVLISFDFEPGIFSNLFIMNRAAWTANSFNCVYRMVQEMVPYCITLAGNIECVRGLFLNVLLSCFCDAYYVLTKEDE